MEEEKNKELVFKERLDYYVDAFGQENQEGVKAVLRECQDLFGYVSSGHQKQIIEEFNISKRILKTMLKFIPSIRESIIEYEVVCCSGSRCSKNGSLEVIKAIRDGLNLDFNETSDDGKIRLSTQNCFKKCNLGPNVMVNGKFHHQMNKEKADKLCGEILEDVGNI